MKTYREFIDEALPPHLQKIVNKAGDVNVIDRTPSFKKDIGITVPRNQHKNVSAILKKNKIRHSSKGSGSGSFSFVDDKLARKAISLIKNAGIKIILSDLG
jgi:hypothetical protein